MSDGTVNDLTALTYPVLSWWLGRVLCDEAMPGVGVIATHFWRVIRQWDSNTPNETKNQKQSLEGRGSKVANTVVVGSAKSVCNVG